MRTIALDSQILNTVQACARKANLEFLQNWRPTEKAEALEKGDLMHRMLAHLYRARMKQRTDLGKVIEEAIEIAHVAAVDMSLTDSTVDENTKQFKEYAIHYQNDGWKPLEVERPFSKVLYRREDEVVWRVGDVVATEGTPGAQGTVVKEGLQILYEGVIDLVADTPHGIFVVDHKTASRRSTPTKLSNQFMGYCWATGSYNFVVNRIGFQKTLSVNERFQRPFLSYNKQILDEWAQSAIYWTKVLVGYIDTGYFPPNFTSCDKYSGCIFQGVCEAIPEVREFKLQSNFYVGEPWSPHTRDGIKADDNG
jgi:hypothetical protein